AGWRDVQRRADHPARYLLPEVLHTERCEQRGQGVARERFLLELDGLAPRRNRGSEPERADLRLERRLCGGIAVHDEGRARFLGEVAQPGEELGLVRMRGESTDRTHLAVDLEVLPVDPHLLRALLQVRAERAVALIADEEQGHTRIADERFDVLDDAPAGDHPI